MERVDKILREMDFAFFASGQHKIGEEAFLARDDTLLLDLRGPEEVRAVPLVLEGVVPVLHVPLNELPDRVQEIPRDRLVGLFCSSGTRSAMAYLYLRALGYENVRALVGGYGPLLDALKPGKLGKLLGIR